MDTARLLADAMRAVDEAGIPPELREIAFSKAIELLAANPAASPRESKPTPDSNTPTSRLDLVARRVGVPVAVVGDVYFEEEGELMLSVPSTRLSRDRANGTREIALLLAAGRQAGGYDQDWTPSSVIREACIYYGKFDPKNFAFTLARMDEFFQVKGKGQKREVRVKQPGFERAAQLLREMSSSDTA